MIRPHLSTTHDLEGPPQRGERARWVEIEEQPGPFRPRELLGQAEQLREARALVSDATRCLLRGGVPLERVLSVLPGVAGTLEYLRHHPREVAVWLRGEEVEKWRR